MTNEELAAFIEKEREIAPTAEIAGINPDLIRQYADQYKSGDEAGFTNLLTVLNMTRRGEAQARSLSQAYLNQIVRMQKDGYVTQGKPINDQSPRPSFGPPQAQGQVRHRMAQNSTKAAGGKSESKSAKEKITLDLDL